VPGESTPRVAKGMNCPSLLVRAERGLHMISCGSRPTATGPAVSSLATMDPSRARERARSPIPHGREADQVRRCIGIELRDPPERLEDLDGRGAFPRG
jgi:hypothetical protein